MRVILKSEEVVGMFRNINLRQQYMLPEELPYHMSLAELESHSQQFRVAVEQARRWWNKPGQKKHALLRRRILDKSAEALGALEEYVRLCGEASESAAQITEALEESAARLFEFDEQGDIHEIDTVKRAAEEGLSYADFISRLQAEDDEEVTVS